MNISRSSVLSTNALLAFDLNGDVNEALFLNAPSFYVLSFLYAAATKRSIVLCTTIYISL